MGITTFRDIVNEAKTPSDIKWKSGQTTSVEDFQNAFEDGEFTNIKKQDLFKIIEDKLGITIADKVLDYNSIYKRNLLSSAGRGLWNIVGTKPSTGAKSQPSVKTEPEIEPKKEPKKEPEIEDEEEDEIEAEILSAKVGNSKATSLEAMEKTKLEKYKIPTSTKGEKFENFSEKVLLHMMNASTSTTKASLLLTGDPGTGKTSSIEQFAGLVGMRIITLEAPHTSEEHIIQIPYLVRSGTSKEGKEFQVEDKVTRFEVVNAKASIITDLESKIPIKDGEWDKFITANRHLSPIRDKFRKPIDSVRKTYNTILFIDEFYRITSTRMGNLFRTILNGQLGGTDIPKNVYIIFASNMDNSDGSLAEIPLNHQFAQMDFDKPSKDDFLGYIASKFTSADLKTGISYNDGKENDISPSVYNLFSENITTEELGGKDTKDIRVSPRRWEEIIKYVNANIPPKNQKMAEALIHYIYTNMRNYETNDLFDNVEKYVTLVKDLIKKESNIDVSKVLPPKGSEWEGMFYNQIETKMKMGKDRKYVLSLAGLPGVGKTSVIKSLTDKFKLKVIVIDAAELNPDDVIGLTIPEGEGKNLETKFSEPPLYARIMRQYDPKLVIENSKYTHILFLDEISRTSKQVMNSIRSLLLEKKINSNYELPENMMIVTAMNPKDTGTEPLSDHMKDVMDVIDVEVNYSKLLEYIRNRGQNKNVNETLGFNLTEIVTSIANNIVETLRSNTNSEGEKISGNTINFFWKFNNNVIYVSGREVDDMISGAVGVSGAWLSKFANFDSKAQYEPEDYNNFIVKMQELIGSSFDDILKFVAIQKHKVSLEDYQGLLSVVESEIARSSALFDDMKKIKSKSVNSIFQLFQSAGSEFGELLGYEGTGSLIDDYIDVVEAEEFTASLMQIANEIKGSHSSNHQKFLEMSTDFFKLLTKINWKNANNKYSANASEIITRYLFKPFANDAYELVKKDKKVNFKAILDKLYNKKQFDTLVGLVRTSNNIFVKPKPKEKTETKTEE